MEKSCLSKKQVQKKLCLDVRAEEVVDGIQHAIDVLGEDHVCFGSDFDGSILPSFDISELPVLTQVMLDRGMAESTVQKIAGGNALRLFRAILPA